MAEDILIQLPGIDPTILTDVVRQDQRSPRFEITSWSVRRLSDKGIINPDGLWFLSGEGQDQAGSRSWSLVLKIFQRPEQETLPSDLWYWKRELLLAQSGFLDHLPGPIKAPRFYRAEETASGAWLWQEYIEPRFSATKWGLAEYAFAAYQLGYWNGACATSAPLPTESWLTRQHYRSWYTETNPEQDFQFALNQQYITDTLRAHYDRLWAERGRFYRTLESLPQTFSHFDSQRRNLFIRQGNNAQDELVLIDWALCGIGPLGAELYGLVSMSATLLDWPPNEVAQLDTAVFVHYLRGLREAGWRGNTDNVRLGYTAWVATWFGVVLPNAFALWCTPEFRQTALQAFGLAEEELYLQWLPVLSYALDCADEAWLLMQKLHLP
jgi:hypothetical protein